MNWFKLFFTSALFFSLSADAAWAEETLTWHDCVREAAKNNPDLIASVQEVKQSVAGKDITASALLPQIDADLGASTARGATGAVADSYDYGVSGTQLLFDGTKTINEVRAAKEDIIAAQERFRFTSTTVRFSLRSAFINLLRAQEMLRITREIYEIRRSSLELITLRYESGLEHKGALLTAQADLAGAEYGMLQAVRDVEVTQRELIKAMGRPQLTPLKAEGDFQVKDAARAKPDFVELAKNNPQIQQLAAQKKAAEYGVRSAYANFFPTLTGQAGAGKSGAHWSPKNDQWNLGLSLSLPIFEGGLRLAQVSQAKALLEQLSQNQRSTRDNVILVLEQAWADLQDAVDNVGVERLRLAADEMRARISEAQYSLGVMGFDNWIIIQNNLVTSKRAYLDAQAAALLAEAGWIQAKGETLEYE